jgi:type IV pilus assembly protein PilB
MSLPLEKLKEILVTGGHIDDAAFERATTAAVKKNEPIEIALVQSEILTDEKLGGILADYYGVQFVDLSQQDLDNELLEMIPEAVAKSQCSVIYAETPTGYSLATTKPDNFEFIKHLDQTAKGRLSVFYATPLAMQEALKSYKDNIYKNVADLVEDHKVNNNENNIVLIVNQFLEYAYNTGASDVHIEPLSDGNVSVRFRVDGILTEVVRYPINIHEKVVFRIKIMAHLRTDERDATQDGRFEYKKEGIDFDVRVSILPVTNGENIVFRILSERTKKVVLEDLGFNPVDIQKVRRAIDQPYGMILVVGPTGAGKTTTLYALVQILAVQPINIVTVEDPVEYTIDKVQQIQVNAKKNITFANGLRSIVRQDPDVIMVGEIRDNETATIAVNAAMTGHLLFSTLHSNDAGTIFPRLLEMGIEPFLVASSVNIVVAQRLVRKVCPHCKINYPKTAADVPAILAQVNNPVFKKMMDKFFPGQKLSDIKLYKGSGCKVCKHSGYLGRIAVFEVMEIDDHIRAVVTARQSASIISSKAEELGMTPMYYNGLIHLFNGVTTAEEIESLSNAD